MNVIGFIHDCCEGCYGVLSPYAKSMEVEESNTLEKLLHQVIKGWGFHVFVRASNGGRVVFRLFIVMMQCKLVIDVFYGRES